MPEVIPPVASTPGVFLETIRTMGGGRTLLKLEEALRDATKAALDAGAKAKLTIELVVTPAGHGAGDVPLLKIIGKVKRTLPEKPEQESSYFADDDFNLSRRNPKQEEMKLTAIDGGGAISRDDLKAASGGK
jgi:hypothetical protein